MSTMTAARVAPRPASTTSRVVPRPTRLRVVDATPKHQSHTGFVLLCFALVLGGLMSGLLLNTARAEGSFVLSDLRSQTTTLHDTKVTIQAELSEHRSPATLAQRADRLGMVPSPSTAVLRLSDGSVIGVAAVVEGTDRLTVDTSSVGTSTERAGTGTEDATKEG